MKYHFSINSLEMSFIFISEYNQTYHTYRLVYCLHLTLCYYTPMTLITLQPKSRNRSCFCFSRLFSLHLIIASVFDVRLRVMSRATFNRSKRIGRAGATPKMLARGSRRRETRVPARPLQRLERSQQIRGEARSELGERKGSQTGLEGCTSAVPKTGSRRPGICF